ncbi:MAG: hypothetical protein GY705_29055 [Bacteroidetes bacterium]|nr:hypothetical protein [Bacteroidota bacterium]
MKGNQEVLLDFDGDVKVQAWNSDLLRVQMTIALDNGNDCLLKSLIKAGRYNLFSKLEGNEFKIFAPSLHKEVKVGNVVLTEHVSYFINVPSDILIRQAEEASTFVQSKTTP